MILVYRHPNHVKAWVKWNYEGLEKKKNYPIFKELVRDLDGTPGRLANDLHDYNNNFGSVRIFELIPAIMDKDIIEGGIMNSATTSMFSYYIQCETSKNCAGYPTVMHPTKFNINNATKHLQLANVKHFIAYWARTKRAFLNHPDWKLLKKVGPYMLFEDISNRGNYVYVPKYYPQIVKTPSWKPTAMLWIYNVNAIDIPFILSYRNNIEIPPKANILTEREYITFLMGLVKTGKEVPVWLSLGPFYYKEGISDMEALDLDPVDIKELNPKALSVQFGKRWRPLIRFGPIFLNQIYRPDTYFICYNYVNIVSDKDQDVILHYSNDDGCKIYLNGKLVVKSGFTGIKRYGHKKVCLKKGDNHLIYQLQQGPGGVYFHLKVTDIHGNKVKGIRYVIDRYGERLLKQVENFDNIKIVEEKFTDNEIRFRTNALHKPHIIKVSYFPNWKVKGAKRVYHVTPNFMLVYPEREEVTLYYGSLPCDIIGRIFTLFGCLWLIYYLIKYKILKKDEG